MKLFTYNTNTLEYENLKYTSIFKGLSILFLVFICLGVNISPRPVSTNLSIEEKLIVIREYDGFSEDKLISKIKELNIKYPYIVLAQSYQETGHFTSRIFYENHNCFGMKEAKIRNNLAKGTLNGHALYNNWGDSVLDYALFNATYLSDIRSESEYFAYLEQNYAEDPQYVERLKSLIKKYNLKNKFL